MKINLKKIILTASLSVVAFSTALVGFSGVLNQSYKVDTSYSNWMSEYNDSTLIKDMNIPGTHDTMALYNFAGVAGQCQSLTLNRQLQIGVRFLDIRLKEDNNDLKAVHGFVDQKAKFSEIADTIESFLKKNNSEFIIVSVKEEAKASKSTISFEEALLKHISSDIWRKETTVPSTLGEVRGKAVLLSRYPNSTVGIEAYSGWADNTSFTMAGSDIYVQDYYKLENTDAKKEAILNCFNEGSHALKINFLSGYLTKYVPPSYAPSVALDINPWINKEIKNHANRGIVLYDFVSENLMKGWFA